MGNGASHSGHRMTLELLAGLRGVTSNGHPVWEKGVPRHGRKLMVSGWRTNVWWWLSALLSAADATAEV